jgi:hypothetical protein
MYHSKRMCFFVVKYFWTMKRVGQLFLILALITIFNQCAKEAAPTGGPKDFDPPVVVDELPSNYTAEFESKKVKIYFDEFISLSNLQDELLISPPFEKKPKFIIKGKRLVITFLDSLPENKTVNLNFYNAIVDVNESNVLKNYQYVFSTGSEIDTSFIDGRLLDAETGKPIEKQLVFAYEKFDDSIVAKQLPSYIARTNQDGIFVINNLGEGPYKLFALIDKNRNNLFDQPSEQVAFVSDSIYPAIEWTTLIDTIKLVDSVIAETSDTIFRDSISERRVQVSKLKPFQLRIFVKDFKKHFLTNATREQKNIISLGFNRDLDTLGYSIEIISPDSVANNWYFEEEITRDSVLLWITDSTLYNSDSIYCRVTYPFTDTSDNIVPQTDSIYFIYDFDQLKKTDTLLVISNNLRTNNLDIDTVFEIFFSEPLKTLDTSKVYLLYKPDTAFLDYDYELKLAEDRKSMQVRFKQDLLSSYRFILDSTAAKGIYGNTHDSTTMNFKYYQYEDYGNLILTLDTIPANGIFNLYNKSGKLVRSIRKPEDLNIEYKQLPPDEYQMKLLIDSNHNGKWDTGDYFQNKQPELVISYTGTIPVKANWDTEQNWNLSKELHLYD